MTRSRVVRVRATGVGHVTRRDAERVRDETSRIGPGSSGRRDGVGTGCGTSHNTPTVSASSASAPMSAQSTQNPSANPSTLSAVPGTHAPDITVMANAINALVQSNVPSRVKLREPNTFDGSDPKKL